MRPGRLGVERRRRRRGRRRRGRKKSRVGLFSGQSHDLLDAGSLEAASAALLLDLTG